MEDERLSLSALEQSKDSVRPKPRQASWLKETSSGHQSKRTLESPMFDQDESENLVSNEVERTKQNLKNGKLSLDFQEAQNHTESATEESLLCCEAASIILGGKGVLHAKTLQDLALNLEELPLLGSQTAVDYYLESSSPEKSRSMRLVRDRLCNNEEAVLETLYRFTGTRYQKLLPVTVLFTSSSHAVLVYLPSDHPKTRKAIAFEPFLLDDGRHGVTRFSSVRALSAHISQRLREGMNEDNESFAMGFILKRRSANLRNQKDEEKLPAPSSPVPPQPSLRSEREALREQGGAEGPSDAMLAARKAREERIAARIRRAQAAERRAQFDNAQGKSISPELVGRGPPISDDVNGYLSQFTSEEGPYTQNQNLQKMKRTTAGERNKAELGSLLSPRVHEDPEMKLQHKALEQRYKERARKLAQQRDQLSHERHPVEKESRNHIQEDAAKFNSNSEQQDRLEKDRLEKERLEQERLVQERLDQKRLEQKRREQLQLEQERLEQKRLEQKRLEQERLEKERLEQERLEQERLEQERLEQERLEQERLEQKRLEKERLEQERLEQERLEQERLEQERLEQKRLEKEHLEQKRLEQERLEQERLEQERLEQERLEQERLEKERLEQERLEKERLEQERLEKERLEKERLKQERLKQERLKQERLEKERLEKERLEKERLEKERLEKERLEKERLEKERLKQERLKQERLKQERLEQERLEQERLEQERLEQERLEQERLEQERLEKERLEKERLEKERLEKEHFKQERVKQGRLLREEELKRQQIDLERRQEEESSFRERLVKERNEQSKRLRTQREKFHQTSEEEEEEFTHANDINKKRERNYPELANFEDRTDNNSMEMEDGAYQKLYHEEKRREYNEDIELDLEDIDTLQNKANRSSREEKMNLDATIASSVLSDDSDDENSEAEVDLDTREARRRAFLLDSPLDEGDTGFEGKLHDASFNHSRERGDGDYARFHGILPFEGRMNDNNHPNGYLDVHKSIRAEDNHVHDSTASSSDHDNNDNPVSYGNSTGHVDRDTPGLHDAETSSPRSSGKFNTDNALNRGGIDSHKSSSQENVDHAQHGGDDDSIGTEKSLQDPQKLSKTEVSQSDEPFIKTVTSGQTERTSQHTQSAPSLTNKTSQKKLAKVESKRKVAPDQHYSKRTNSQVHNQERKDDRSSRSESVQSARGHSDQGQSSRAGFLSSRSAPALGQVGRDEILERLRMQRVAIMQERKVEDRLIIERRRHIAQCLSQELEELQVDENHEVPETKPQELDTSWSDLSDGSLSVAPPASTCMDSPFTFASDHNSQGIADPKDFDIQEAIPSSSSSKSRACGTKDQKPKDLQPSETSIGNHDSPAIDNSNNLPHLAEVEHNDHDAQLSPTTQEKLFSIEIPLDDAGNREERLRRQRKFEEMKRRKFAENEERLRRRANAQQKQQYVPLRQAPDEEVTEKHNFTHEGGETFQHDIPLYSVRSGHSTLSGAAAPGVVPVSGKRQSSPAGWGSARHLEPQHHSMAWDQGKASSRSSLDSAHTSSGRRGEGQPSSLQQHRRQSLDETSVFTGGATSARGTHPPSVCELPPEIAPTIEIATKSNLKLIMNAITHVCLAGAHHVQRRDNIIRGLEDRSSSGLAEFRNAQYVILFRNEVALKFRGIYVVDRDTNSLRKLQGAKHLPATVDASMIDSFYKYNTGQKRFLRISTKSITRTTDAVALNPKFFPQAQRM